MCVNKEPLDKQKYVVKVKTCRQSKDATASLPR